MPRKKINFLKNFIYTCITDEISSMTKYYRYFVQISPMKNDVKTIFNRVEAPNKVIQTEKDDLKKYSEDTVFFINGNLNYDMDIQKTLSNILLSMRPSSRLVCLLYNPYLKWAYILANFLGLINGETPLCFVTKSDFFDLIKISGFEFVNYRPIGYFPFKWFGFGRLINTLFSLIPILKNFSLVGIYTLRPILEKRQNPSLSIVIPARNEKGNIENALKRIPTREGIDIEVVFVEGHSIDSTWEEIQRVIPLYSDKFKIMALKQTGKGKNDAVRLGLVKSSGELLTILDADLAMPPEDLLRFYDAYRQNHGEFINGSRLVYPMEGDAMRFLNLVGNKFFAKALSYLLNITLSDTLCGTKMFTREYYQKLIQWRNHFGDFDPFGDFELIFAAATLGHKIVNIPMQYRARTYGTTQIQRFRHGFILLKMTMIGFFRFKLRVF